MANRMTDRVVAVGTTEQHLGTGAVVDVEVVTTSGRAAAVQFFARARNVEVWHQGRCWGVFDRVVLTRWAGGAADPVACRGALRASDVQLDVDWSPGRAQGRIAITLPGVRGWALSPSDQLALIGSLGWPDLTWADLTR